MLFKYEDGDIIAAFLANIRRWCGGGGWQPRYFVTLAFEDLTGDASVEQFLCHTEIWQAHNVKKPKVVFMQLFICVTLKRDAKSQF